MASFASHRRRTGQHIKKMANQMLHDEDNSAEKLAYQNELKEWAEINLLLRSQGFAKVKILHPADLSSDEVVCMDLDTSDSLRGILLSLLSERSEGQESFVKKYQTKVKDLKVMLECSRSRVKELERESKSRLSYESEEGERLRNTKNMAVTKHRQLEHQCQEQELEIDMLRKKLRRLIEEENKRISRQNQVFQEFKKRTARAHSVMDEKLLDIIDAYENQVNGLQRQLDASRLGISLNTEDEDESMSAEYLNPSQNVKGIIKSYEKKIHSLQTKIRHMEEEGELLKMEMGAKPEVKDYRLAAQRVKKLEKLLSVHNINVPGEKVSKDPFRLKRKYNTRVDDLDYLPLDFCQQYLRDISAEIGVEDIDRICMCIQAMKDEVTGSKKYEQICHRIHTIVEEVDRAGQGTRGHRSSLKRQFVLTEKNLQHDLFILENWSKDMAAIQDLQFSINQLLEKLAPWAKVHLSGEHNLEQMIETLDSVSVEENPCSARDGRQLPSRTVLENIVEHFMTLFDVPSVTGVFPRMNELYTKLGEVHNVMNTLRNVLGLADDCKSSAVVDSVGRLCQAHNSTTVRQLKQLLQTDDLDGVIRRLDEHRNFFPAFQEVMNKLFHILGIERMDQVVPAVRALKLLSH